ncbi:hypothetical protein GA0070609_5551 [Micromonospora echinaurantiaca]|uniref:Uncharacterized protein n=1 Tax=Micromonospora echinaurantiaca TaxID=47857 RepID=A0A1C5K698_9ACTN|nr:hypothetical protein GA0070609_5551 [Micromonospora echinaurantiaca]
MAAVAAMVAVALLVTLVLWRRQDLVGVVLALLCVLSATVAGVSVAAVRQRDDPEPDAATTAGQPVDGLSGIDADTLETLDNLDAVRAMRERHRGRFSDR